MYEIRRWGFFTILEGLLRGVDTTVIPLGFFFFVSFWFLLLLHLFCSSLLYLSFPRRWRGYAREEKTIHGREERRGDISGRASAGRRLTSYPRSFIPPTDCLGDKFIILLLLLLLNLAFDFRDPSHPDVLRDGEFPFISRVLEDCKLDTLRFWSSGWRPGGSNGLDRWNE